MLNSADAAQLRALLGDQLDLAVTRMEHWCDHPKGASPLGYVAMLRYDTSRGIWRDVPGADMLARALIEAGAPVDGEPGEPETPLITAASYGDAAVARTLIEAARTSTRERRRMPVGSRAGRRCCTRRCSG